MSDKGSKEPKDKETTTKKKYQKIVKEREKEKSNDMVQSEQEAKKQWNPKNVMTWDVGYREQSAERQRNLTKSSFKN